MCIDALRFVDLCWGHFQAAIDNGAVPEASTVLERIRLVVATNLVLGLVVVVVGATGRYW